MHKCRTVWKYRCCDCLIHSFLKEIYKMTKTGSNLWNNGIDWHNFFFVYEWYLILISLCNLQCQLINNQMIYNVRFSIHQLLYILFFFNFKLTDFDDWFCICRIWTTWISPTLGTHGQADMPRFQRYAD